MNSSASREPEGNWKTLNQRQQHYLTAIFEVDQAKEQAIKRAGARGHWNSTPASIWRWIPYNAAGSPLLRRIQEAGYQDQGTGSTFASLERRSLVLCKYKPGSLGSPILFVQITKTGRALVRQALHIQAPKALPVGTLQEKHWKALVMAYQAGERGVLPEVISGEYGALWWNIWLRLRDYQDQGQRNASGRRDYRFM